MSNTKEELISTIKNWITTDNDIKTLSKQLKEKRNVKKQLTNNLVNTMKSNEIDCFEIANGKLCHSSNKIKGPISKKLLQTSLNEYFPDSPAESVDKIIQHIMDSRNITVKDNIRFKEPKS